MAASTTSTNNIIIDSNKKSGTPVFPGHEETVVFHGNTISRENAKEVSKQSNGLLSRYLNVNPGTTSTLLGGAAGVATQNLSQIIMYKSAVLVMGSTKATVLAAVGLLPAMPAVVPYAVGAGVTLTAYGIGKGAKAAWKAGNKYFESKSKEDLLKKLEGFKSEANKELTRANVQLQNLNKQYLKLIEDKKLEEAGKLFDRFQELQQAVVVTHDMVSTADEWITELDEGADHKMLAKRLDAELEELHKLFIKEEVVDDKGFVIL